MFYHCCARVLNGIEIPTYRSSVLNVGETMQFHAPVEETALKRRTSRLLLPLPAQRKPKVRELALTSHRLVSLKPLKNGRGVGIKAELVLREFQGQLAAGSSGREKRSKSDEARRMVMGVERKGAKEFVVLTVSLGLLLGRTCRVFRAVLTVFFPSV
jgi:3-phosphoinositide dependent protein kinase-1